MSDFILLDGDSVQFMPAFGAALVTPLPGSLQGSGPANGKGRHCCVEGDERNVAVRDCVYMTPQYAIPGSGTLKIERLAADQTARTTRTGGKALLLKGSSFTAVFEVQRPAQQVTPAGAVPDPTPRYGGGVGQFITSNQTCKAG